MQIKVDWHKIDMDKIISDLRKSYGEQMKADRLKLGLSPAQVAVEFGVSQATIYNNENGTSVTRGLSEFYKNKLEGRNNE